MKNICRLDLIQKIIAIVFAILLWEFISRKLNQRVLLASPLEVIRSLGALLVQKSCWESVLFSIEHILAGFFVAFVAGIVLAKLSNHVHLIEMLLWPYIQVIKATPVASFIILCLVWVDIKNLSTVVSFFMVFPVIYYEMLTGMRMKNQDILEMAKVNHISWYYRFFVIDLFLMRGPLLTAVSTGIALAFKSGIAAELIGTPKGSIGAMLYQAKIYLCTADMMAWTIIIIVCSVIFERIVKLLIHLLYRGIEKGI